MAGKNPVFLQVARAARSARTTQVQIRIADGFLSRLLGLLLHKSLADTDGLLLVPCSSIHTMGMRFTIDVIFLDASNCVVGWSDRVPPNRFRLAPKGTVKVLEIAEGNRIRTGIHLDDLLIFD